MNILHIAGTKNAQSLPCLEMRFSKQAQRKAIKTVKTNKEHIKHINDPGPIEKPFIWALHTDNTK